MKADTATKTIVHPGRLPQPLARQIRWFNAPEDDIGAGAPPIPAPPMTPPVTDDDTKGRGSKQAVLDDLAKERDARQNLEREFTALKDGLTKALGLNQDDTPDPAKLVEQLAASTARIKELESREAIRALTPPNVDVEGLLDSTTFNRTLTTLNMADTATVKAHIEEFVKDHPRYVTPAPGVRDAAWSARNPNPDPTATAKPGVDRLAAGLDQQYNTPPK